MKRTERECYDCGDGTFYEHDGDLVCNNCSFTPTATGPQRTDPSTAWEQFWTKRRAKQNGFYGEGRVRFVGAL